VKNIADPELSNPLKSSLGAPAMIVFSEIATLYPNQSPAAPSLPELLLLSPNRAGLVNT
jgi:hypothetical protein